MRCVAEPDAIVYWHPSGLPRTACIMQAVVLAAASTVIFQSVVNLFWPVPSVLLHLIGFSMSLPVFWFARLLNNEAGSGQRGLSGLALTTQSVLASFHEKHGPVPMRVTEVGRYWGALTLSLKPDSSSAECSDAGRAKAIRVTLWESNLGKEMFRKISLLALWHARRAA